MNDSKALKTGDRIIVDDGAGKVVYTIIDKDAPFPAPKQRRGFAVMTPEQRRAIASLGGIASHESGRGHEWTPETAREAGRKGGAVSRGGKGKMT